jgi:hypothetical protein
VTANLLGREVLVMLLNGKPRAFANVCVHHGGPLILDDDIFRCEWYRFTAPSHLFWLGPAKHTVLDTIRDFLAESPARRALD